MNSDKNSSIVYVVSTYYHALIACIKQINQPCPADIIVTAYIPEGRLLTQKLEESKLFLKCIFVDEIKEYRAENKIDYCFNFHRKNAALIEKQIPFSFQKYREINVFHDDIWASHYLKDRKIHYHLMEDALDSFKNISKSSFAYMLPKGGWKEKVKKWLRIGYLYCGLDPFTVSVEVNAKDGVEIATFAPNKLIEIPRKPLFDALTVQDIQKLKEIFAREYPEICSEEYYLLLTRALFADGIVKNEKEQIELHRKLVIGSIGENKKLLIKPHPRDFVDYRNVFGEAIVLDKNMPAEIMPYIGLKKFKGIITFETSRIEGFKAEKTYLG